MLRVKVLKLSVVGLACSACMIGPVSAQNVPASPLQDPDRANSRAAPIDSTPRSGAGTVNSQAGDQPSPVDRFNGTPRPLDARKVDEGQINGRWQTDGNPTVGVSEDQKRAKKKLIGKQRRKAQLKRAQNERRQRLAAEQKQAQQEKQ